MECLYIHNKSVRLCNVKVHTLPIITEGLLFYCKPTYYYY